MQPVKAGNVQATINVTPLVDVVLVLLIIFMVVVPQLASGPAVQLPTTERPPEAPDEGRQIVVAIEYGGTIWIDDDAVTAAEFSETILRTAHDRSDWKVVIKGDARLTFGEIQQAMFAVESAGFKNVGLIAKRHDAAREI